MVACVGVTVGIDQISKAWVVATLDRGESNNVFLGLDITNVRNTGVAFGALSGGGTLLVVGIVAALALLLVYFGTHAAIPWLWLPTGLLLGGALGNLADRAREGAVIDFIDPLAWPAFNLSDAAIVVGVAALLYVLEGRGRRSKA
jgi:signal peptidase II